MPEAPMKVLLISHTPEPEAAVALAGRLCYSDSDILSLKEAVSGRAGEFVEKLLSLGHLSPFEHASFTFAAQGVSRALLAQITRHRIASFMVQSQRYVKKEALDYVIPPTIKALGAEAEERYARQMDVCMGFYREWLEAGLPAEDARFVLPNGAETRMVFTMNARELNHFFALRCCGRAQWEIRDLAWTMLGMCLREAPSLFRASGPGCVGGACTEGRMSCGRAAENKALFSSLCALCEARPGDGEILEFIQANPIY